MSHHQHDAQSTPTTTPTKYTTKFATNSPADLESEATDISEDIAETTSQKQEQIMDPLLEMTQRELERVQGEGLELHHEDKASLEMKQKKEREEFDSSDDEDAEATTPVEMGDAFNEEWAEFDQEEDQDQDQDHDLDIEADAGNELNNEIDIEENFVPIDLSNDIAVNDLAAADPDFPLNPDAEFIAAPAVGRTMPMFEKLSLGEPSK